MSIIVTHINANGIVHAADTNLTDANGTHAGTGSKVFAIPRHDAGMTTAGTYAVGGVRMDDWLRSFISTDMTPSLADFVESLRATVDVAASAHQKQAGYFFHIAGYQGNEGAQHPEFHHVTNYNLTPEGNYTVVSATLRSSEDFWSAHGNRSLANVFANRAGYIYCNGFPSGRQIYFDLLSRMATLRGQVWGNPAWQFRPPSSIAEEAEVLKLDMEHINLFFRQSNYSAPFIGGEIERSTLESCTSRFSFFYAASVTPDRHGRLGGGACAIESPTVETTVGIGEPLALRGIASR
jgi:hypothetical protein